MSAAIDANIKNMINIIIGNIKYVKQPPVELSTLRKPFIIDSLVEVEISHCLHSLTKVFRLGEYFFDIKSDFMSK